MSIVSGAGAGGTSRGDILILVLAEGLNRTVLGSAAGVIAAFVVARSLGTLLFGVGVADPSSSAGAVGLLMSVTLLACVRPAWSQSARCVTTEPITATRRHSWPWRCFTAVAASASYLPARRATQVDPAVALRSE